jgi:L-amino acid N-acyltransferase YncA
VIPDAKRGRWIAEAAGTGQCIGFANFGQSSWSFHPQRFNVGVYVLPGEQEKGVGGALYQTVMEGLTELKPTELHTNVREDWARGLRFAQERGFAEEMREWESCLDVPAFDLARWSEAYQSRFSAASKYAPMRSLRTMPTVTGNSTSWSGRRSVMYLLRPR